MVTRFLTLSWCREVYIRLKAPPWQIPRMLIWSTPVGLADVVHAAVDVAVDVVVQGQGAVGLVRVAPVDQVDVLAGGQQPLDGGAVLLDVGHVGPVDQGVDDQQRDRLGGDALGGVVAVQDQLVLAVDRLAWG